MPLRASLVVGCMLALLPRTLCAQPRDLSYRIDVRLSPPEHVLLGTATIDLTSSAQAPFDEVALQLYPNAFASHQTVFVKEGGLTLRRVALERYGGLDLLALTTEQGEDLLRTAQTELLDGDHTQLRARLPRSVAPGEHLRLRARFRTRLPSLVARMGQAGDFCMLAQWFPKLARLRPDGSWASKPYHGLGEFDADFADYDVTVSVPRDHVIAAPGVRIDRRVDSARKTERFAIQRARDFAFATSPSLEREARVTASGVELEVYAPRGHSALAKAQLELLERGLAALGTRLGKYPYPRLVLVLPPASARGAAGMEYAGLITGLPAYWHSMLTPAGRAAHAVVTMHELAHQWFPMIVSSDEVEAPVLDEGLAQWIGLELVRREYGRAFFEHWLGLSFDLIDLGRARVALRPGVPSSLSTAHALRPGQLGPAIYWRPAALLERIAEHHGREKLWTALGSYARAHRFSHVRIAQLEHALDATYGAGFTKRELLPALAGQRDTAQPVDAKALRAQVPSTLYSRFLALAQVVIGWTGP